MKCPCEECICYAICKFKTHVTCEILAEVIWNGDGQTKKKIKKYLPNIIFVTDNHGTYAVFGGTYEETYEEASM